MSGVLMGRGGVRSVGDIWADAAKSALTPVTSARYALSLVASTPPALRDGRSFLRSMWYDEAMTRASREPSVVRARAQMRSGGLRERVRYWYVLSVHMNRPGYFEYKLAGVIDRLPAGRAEDVAAYSAKPRPLLFFQSPEVMASVALLLGWKVGNDDVGDGALSGSPAA